MKNSFWSNAAWLCLAIALGGCSKKSDSPQDLAAHSAPSNHAPVQPPPTVTNNPPTNAAVPVPTNSPAAQTNAQTAPVRVFPAQDIYEQALNMVKTNRESAGVEEALILFRKAAEQGNAPAQHALAMAYLGGIGVPRDSDQALVWLRKSADEGYAESQFKLASLYARGGVLPKDDAKAAEYARLAAAQGHPEAEYNLGSLYATGRGVPKDEKEAANWFRKAAEAGHPSAQSNLGVIMANGGVFEKNMDEAVKWWRKAAEQGQASAQFNLAQTLVEGKALPKDLIEAYKWFDLAAEQGDEEAGRLRDALGVELEPSQIAEALRRARRFRMDLFAKLEARKNELFTGTTGGNAAAPGGVSDAAAAAPDPGR